MSQRITKVMLQNAVAAYARTLDAHGLLDSPLIFQVGNTTYSYAWTVRFDDGSSPVGTDKGILGYTAREAYGALHTIIRVLNDIKFRNEAL